MPQSSAALRCKALLLRSLRHAQAALPVSTGATRPLRAKKPWTCVHGTCLALDAREGGLWVLVRDTQAQEAWAPVGRILDAGSRRAWAQEGFG
jgi:hypothetical protein